MPRVPSPAAAQIGRNITVYRNAKGWTRDKLAGESGVESSNLAHHEAGRAMVSVPTLVKLATALQTDPGNLLVGVTPELLSQKYPQ
ncbi:MAG: helix-turn-helix domain-containing protein [Cellulomonadaceae bacterium]|nr:helix-turn-helix domain-containing protein [Cellulomonadaceae bacterium]